MSCCGALYFRRRSKPPRKYRLRPLASSKQALRGPHFSVTGGGRVARQTLTCGSSPTCIKNMGYPVRVSHILVPVAGLEPARCRQRWILSPLRLPFHHTGRCVTMFTLIIDRCRQSFIRWPPAGGHMSPSFAVPGGCPRRFPPSSSTDRCTCYALAASATGGARARNSGPCVHYVYHSITPASVLR